MGLGANLGDRAANIRRAVFLLNQTPGVRVLRTAALLESDALTLAVDDPRIMPRFLNTVCEISTELLPRELLLVCQGVEAAIGRQRQFESRRWQPRLIDIDILLYGDKVVSEPGLSIPHPEMHLRLFVLTPLCEIASHAWHPQLRMTAAQLRDALNGAEG